MYIKCRKNLQFCCDRRKYCYFDYKQNGNKKGKLELLLSVKQAATSGSQETQLPSAIHPVGDERAYAMPRRVRKSINCRVFLGYFTIAPLTWLQLCLPTFLSFFVCQVCLLHCPPSTICLKIIAAVVVVGGAAAVSALFSFLLLLLLSLYCAALCGIFCQVHIWDGSKRPKNNCAALIKKLNSAHGRGP